MKDFILFYSWIDVSEMNLSESHNKKKHDHHARNLEISDLCKAKNYSISFLSYPYLTLPYLSLQNIFYYRPFHHENYNESVDYGYIYLGFLYIMFWMIKIKIKRRE